MPSGQQRMRTAALPISINNNILSWGQRDTWLQTLLRRTNPLQPSVTPLPSPPHNPLPQRPSSVLPVPRCHLPKALSPTTDPFPPAWAHHDAQIFPFPNRQNPRLPPPQTHPRRLVTVRPLPDSPCNHMHAQTTRLQHGAAHVAAVAHRSRSMAGRTRSTAWWGRAAATPAPTCASSTSCRCAAACAAASTARCWRTARPPAARRTPWVGGAK